MNIGLLLVECKTDIPEGDVVAVDIDKGIVKDVTSGKEWSFEKYPGFIGELVKAGGLVNLVKEGKF
jgi:hypothetical protein